MQLLELVRSRHSVGESNFHIIFCPAYRRPIFSDWRVKELTRAYILQKSRKMGLVIVAMEFGPDHVHIFIANCRNYSASQVVKHLKGYSAYMMRKHHSELFRKWLYGKKFWSSGYFYRSVGNTTNKAVKHYVETAEKRHFHISDKNTYVTNGQKKLDSFSNSNAQGF